MLDAAIRCNHVNAMKLKQLIWFIALTLVPPFAFSQGTGFTYQGRLTVNSGPATGTYDLQFCGTLRAAAEAWRPIKSRPCLSATVFLRSRSISAATFSMAVRAGCK